MTIAMITGWWAANSRLPRRNSTFSPLSGSLDGEAVSLAGAAPGGSGHPAGPNRGVGPGFATP
ncbi:hypothetical protein GCM10022227_27860 [Streptomyces sedi]